MGVVVRRRAQGGRDGDGHAVPGAYADAGGVVGLDGVRAVELDLDPRQIGAGGGAGQVQRGRDGVGERLGQRAVDHGRPSIARRPAHSDRVK